MNKLDNLFAVVHEQKDAIGNRESKVLRLFRSRYYALQYLRESCDSILKNDYGITLSDLAGNSSYAYNEEDDCCYFANKDTDCWDMLRIERVPIDNRYVDILFKYKGKIYTERIYWADIDIDHYDGCWSEIFGEYDYDRQTDQLVFEFTSDKTEDGKPMLKNVFIDVYDGIYAENACDKIVDGIFVRTSWSSKNWFEELV